MCYQPSPTQSIQMFTLTPGDPSSCDHADQREAQTNSPANDSQDSSKIISMLTVRKGYMYVQAPASSELKRRRKSPSPAAHRDQTLNNLEEGKPTHIG